MEFAPHGNLSKFLRKKRDIYEPTWETTTNNPDVELTISNLVVYAYQIARGMEFLASKKVRVSQNYNDLYTCNRKQESPSVTHVFSFSSGCFDVAQCFVNCRSQQCSFTNKRRLDWGKAHTRACCRNTKGQHFAATGFCCCCCCLFLIFVCDARVEFVCHELNQGQNYVNFYCRIVCTALANGRRNEALSASFTVPTTGVLCVRMKELFSGLPPPG